MPRARSFLPILVPAGCLGMLVIGASVCVVALLLIKFLWAWTVPDLFPGAVEQGLVAREITWLAAFKLALFVAFLAGLAGGNRRT